MLFRIHGALTVEQVAAHDHEIKVAFIRIPECRHETIMCSSGGIMKVHSPASIYGHNGMYRRHNIARQLYVLACKLRCTVVIALSCALNDVVTDQRPKCTKAQNDAATERANVLR